MMPYSVKSNKVMVRDVDKLREVLDRYGWQWIDFNLEEEGSGWTLERTRSADHVLDRFSMLGGSSVFW
jgi:hypothetical protein